jgi:hypothetical protein
MRPKEVTMTTYKCAMCGETKEAPESQIRERQKVSTHKLLYCSITCSGKANSLRQKELREKRMKNEANLL